MLVLGGALSRLIPHAPNLTAITAIALLGGASLSNRWAAVLVPLAALWISDLILGFHGTMIFVYLAMAVIALVANLTLKKSFQWPKLIGCSLAASLFFFAVTNFGVWWMDSLYAKTWSGLALCYEMAIPFLTTQVAGDLFYSVLLFGVVQMLQALNPQLARN